jgi:hypothetical protein
VHYFKKREIEEDGEGKEKGRSQTWLFGFSFGVLSLLVCDQQISCSLCSAAIQIGERKDNQQEKEKEKRKRGHDRCIVAQ